MSRQFKNGSCSCWNKLDKELKETNAQLDLGFDFAGKLYLNIATIFLDEDKKKRGSTPKRVFASYCPFCGSKLK